MSSTHDHLAAAAIFVVLSARPFLWEEDVGEKRGEGWRGIGEERGGKGRMEWEM